MTTTSLPAVPGNVFPVIILYQIFERYFDTKPFLMVFGIKRFY